MTEREERQVTPPDEGAGGRPVIVATGRQLRDVAREAEHALVEGNTGHDGSPVLYMRNAGPVRLRHDVETGELVTDQLSNAAMLDRLAEVADWQSTTTN